jgi:hypothetical protein
VGEDRGEGDNPLPSLNPLPLTLYPEVQPYSK